MPEKSSLFHLCLTTLPFIVIKKKLKFNHILLLEKNTSLKAGLQFCHHFQAAHKYLN